ncbi:MAG: hypothetical protein WAW16_08790 [Candidatus Cryosericum sp.]
MTLKEQILAELKNGPMSDRELADKLLGLRAPPQSINQTCRQLSKKGIIMRTTKPIKNMLATAEHIPQIIKKEEDSPLSEEAIKKILNDHLLGEGWQTKVAWGGAHGIDIDARRGLERWIIEVKGSGSRNPMRVNYYVSILGEVLQRMDDPSARYSIALPNMQQSRNLWMRLPALAKRCTAIGAIFVSENGTIDLVE